MAKPTRVLVTYASRMGATQEIAEAIGRQLQRSGVQITVAACADDISSKGFDGVIIGSAIYTRRWLKAATRYLKRHADEFDPHEHGFSTAVPAARAPVMNRSRLRGQSHGSSARGAACSSHLRRAA